MLLAVFFTIILCISVAIVMVASRVPAGKSVRERLSTIRRKEESNVRAIELAEKETPAFANWGNEYLKRNAFADSLQRLLLHSGVAISVGAVALRSLGLGFGAALLVYWLSAPVLLTVPAFFVAGSGPTMYLIFQRNRRLNKFNAALPDAIDLMSRALRAGHSVSSSIEVVAQQSPEPLAGEFDSCFQQQKFGIPFRDALLAMGERVPSDDLQFLVTAVLVQKETGGDLTDILDRTTVVIRDRIRIQGEVRTRTAQGRLTGWILSGLPIALLILINIITPGYSTVLFHDPLGQKLLMAGSVFILIGGFIISRIVDIKV